MRQLSGVDVSFLHVENSRVTGHVGGLLIVDPSTASEPITADAVRRFYASKIHKLAPLRWQLVNVPYGFDRPYWHEVQDPDLNYHIRGVTVPSPGSEEELVALVSRLHARPLDRAHPLWEVYVIDGLDSGKLAIYTKLHHAAIDGKAGMAITATVLSTSPDVEIPDMVELPPPSPVPSEAEMFTRGWNSLLSQPEKAMKLWGDVTRETQRFYSRMLTGASEWTADASPPQVAPKLSFNRTISAQRNYTFGTASLSDVKKIKERHDCTVNDVVMAMCTSALRRWLIDHDELPRGPLLAMVPISIRAADASEDVGNQVSSLQVALPTNVGDPAERLRMVSAGMRSAKETHKALPANLLQDFTQFTAPAAAEAVALMAANMKWADSATMPFNVVISNVPGPRETLYYLGAKLEANYPVSMITDGMGLNITVHSYRDSIDFGVVSTPEFVPDITRLRTYIIEAIDELLAL